jgi:Cd2+/Zn2+-exporting ATPase
VLAYAAGALAYSTHPAAVSIRKYTENAGAVPESGVEVEELAGYGVSALVQGRRVLAGSARLLASHAVAVEGGCEPSGAGTRVYVAVDGAYAGCISIADELKPDARGVCDGLRELGVRKLAMLTGDNARTGQAAADALGIEARCELLPEDKLAELEKLDAEKACGKKLVFVGDGINDAPVLARADVGIAMGAFGSDAAIEAADIVLMTDELSRIPKAIRIARKTRGIVIQNIVFALGIKAAILVCGALGLASIWMAVFGDVGVALLAVLNAMRGARD